MTRRHPTMCLLAVWMTTHDIKGFKTPKRGWLGIFQPKWQIYKIVISPAGNIGSIPNFDTVIEPHSWLREWSRITKFLFKMAYGSHIAEYWKRYNSPINGPIWMKLGWSHSIMSPICPPCCGCHGNGRCLATAHCTFSSYGRLEVERVNQFWWNLVHNSKLGPQCQSRDQILRFLKFKMADGRHVWKSHTRTVVRECCKGDEASQWRKPKFDPPPRPHTVSDRNTNRHRWLRRGPLRLCKS